MLSKQKKSPPNTQNAPVPGGANAQPAAGAKAQPAAGATAHALAGAMSAPTPASAAAHSAAAAASATHNGEYIPYASSATQFIDQPSYIPRPKALALTILIDWSNQEKKDPGSNPTNSLHPCWLCLHFGPPPSALPLQHGQHALAGQWQYTVNIYSAEKTPIVKRQNEEPIPKERRAVLWFNGQPFDSYRYANVAQHVRFPPRLMPRVIAFHADRAEPDVNALVWVKKKTSQKRHKEDSYLKVVRGHIYHIHMTFPDGSLVNQYVAQGWGFTASLFTYKRKRGHINVSPSRAVTQIRANWLDVVEADPDHEELAMAKNAKAQDERDDANALAEEETAQPTVPHRGSNTDLDNSSSRPSRTPIVAGNSSQPSAAGSAAAGGISSGPASGSSQPPSLANTSPLPPGYGGFGPLTPAIGGPSTIGPNSSTPGFGNAPPAADPAAQDATMHDAGEPRSASKKLEFDKWTQGDLNSVLKPGPVDLPDIKDLKGYEPAGVDLGPEVDAFFDAPSAPAATPATATAAMGSAAGMYHPMVAAQPSQQQQLSMSDRELLSLFRALEQRAKSVATDSNSLLRESAVRLTQVLSASGQLGGWKHVEEFMTDQELYARKARAVERSFGRPHSSITRSLPSPAAASNVSSSAAASNAPSSAVATSNQAPEPPRGKIDELSENSQALLKSAMIRAKWVLDIEKKNLGQLSDGKTLDRVLGVLQKDQKWMQDSFNFLKSAEQQVINLINMNPAVFAKFRELQSRGVQWPHSPHLRRHIERAGFVFRPMMIKRDRCVCDACGVEMSGWRPWHNPWLFHDWSKRHPFAPPPGTLSRAGTQNGT